jgi:hypothetical protein
MGLFGSFTLRKKKPRQRLSKTKESFSESYRAHRGKSKVDDEVLDN